jgi:methionine-rich copper-binding protein CopC
MTTVSRVLFMACRRIGCAAAILMLIALPLSPAAAHAVVVASTPAADAVVQGPGFNVRVEFNQRIDPKRSKLTIVSAAGQTYPVQMLEVEDVNVLAGQATAIEAGSYRLRWQVLAIDGHITRGEIPFAVSSP